jgi:DNA-binding response OmpR family regulator
LALDAQTEVIMTPESKDPARPMLLVAEDDKVMVKLLSFLFQREGYDAAFAADGRQALEMIETHEPPRLVLLDIMLPHVNGLELVPAIRKKSDWNGVPIIMLTADSAEKDIVRALDAGANDYVVKPFNPQEFMARLRRLIRQER